MRNIFSLNTFKINLCAWSLYRLFWRDNIKKKEDATQKRLNLVLEEGKNEDEIKKNARLGQKYVDKSIMHCRDRIPF